MSIADCAELVKQADEDRFMATMGAKPAMREVLFPLYAFNVEISRAAWASSEPLVCQMRLQYWHDMIDSIFDGGAGKNHPIAGSLAMVIAQGGLVKHHLTELIDARLWDVWGEPFKDATEFETYIKHTSGHMMSMAARVTGVSDHYEGAIHAHGYGMGVANFLLAVPELKARGRQPLLDESPQALADLAQAGLDALAELKKTKAHGARAAVAPAWDSTRVLKWVAKQPERVLEGRLQTSPFRRKTSLLLLGLLG